MNLRSLNLVNSKKLDVKSGLIFNVVHGSFVDGYGVRTTVFLKGCPLRCLWCCNPEGQKGYPEIRFMSSLCNGCGRCLQVCAANAISLDAKATNNKITIDRNLCTNCGKCIEVCYTGALDFFGKYTTLEELLETVKKDEQFYRESDGGVTIGGGEPTFQSSFTLEFIRECRKHYLHTAVDTCGYTLTSEGFKVLEEADLLLYDLKGINLEEHIKNTGVSNEIILENLKRLNSLEKPIIIRIPVIPDFTDSERNIESTAKFLSTFKSVIRVDIIPYHEYGKIKYEQLGREYSLNLRKLTQQKLDNIKVTLENYGLKIHLGG